MKSWRNKVLSRGDYKGKAKLRARKTLGTATWFAKATKKRRETHGPCRGVHSCSGLEILMPSDKSLAAAGLQLVPRLRPWAKARRDGTRMLSICGHCGCAGHLARACDARVPVIVLGDSHSSVWTLLQHIMVGAVVVRTAIRGVSAQGLANSHSTLDAARRFREAIRCFAGAQQKKMKHAWLCVQLGQVDVDFLLPFRRLRHLSHAVCEALNKDPRLREDPDPVAALRVAMHAAALASDEEAKSAFDAQLRRSISSLCDFLESLMPSFDPERLILHGCHLPPLDDDAMKVTVLEHYRAHVSAVVSKQAETPKQGWGEDDKVVTQAVDAHFCLPSHEERTRRAMQWNRALAEEIEVRGRQGRLLGCRIVDLAPSLLDPTTRIVQRRYTFPVDGMRDIHLSDPDIGELYVSEYARLGIPFASGPQESTTRRGRGRKKKNEDEAAVRNLADAFLALGGAAQPQQARTV